MQVAHLHHHGDWATSVSKHVPLQHMSTRYWREPVKLWVWQRRVSSPSLWFLDLSGLCSTLWLYEAILRDPLCQHRTHEFPSPKTGSGKKHPREGDSKRWQLGIWGKSEDAGFTGSSRRCRLSADRTNSRSIHQNPFFGRFSSRMELKKM